MSACRTRQRCVFNARARTKFAEHYAQEWDHGAFFIEALETVGVAKSQVAHAEPALATSAVLNHMRRCARVDPLSYAVCSGFLESTGDDRVAGDTFLNLLNQHYGDARDTAAPLQRHLKLDEDYGHNGLLEETCADFGDLSAQRASAALDAGYRLVEVLLYWSDAIVELYTDVDHARLPQGVRDVVLAARQSLTPAST